MIWSKSKEGRRVARGPGEGGLHTCRSMTTGEGWLLERAGLDPLPRARCRTSSSSRRTMCSYSSSCPRKLKLGDIVGRLSLTYLHMPKHGEKPRYFSFTFSLKGDPKRRRSITCCSIHQNGIKHTFTQVFQSVYGLVLLKIICENCLSGYQQ